MVDNRPLSTCSGTKIELLKCESVMQMSKPQLNKVKSIPICNDVAEIPYAVIWDLLEAAL